MQLSCNKQSACLQYANITAKIKFVKNNDTLAILDTILPKPILYFDSFYISSINTKNIAFLLNSTADSMNFVIAADSAINKLDTIHLVYNRQVNFVSKECGYNHFYTLQSATATKNAIKKIEIIQPTINSNNNATHLSILY
jgi:Family of unknown function (DUF6452)